MKPLHSSAVFFMLIILVAFVNDAYATYSLWAVGDRGTLLHTIDGGQTWVPQACGHPSDACMLMDVQFMKITSATHLGVAALCEVVEADQSLMFQTVPLITTDDGETWISCTPIQDMAFKDISFVDANTGWAAACYLGAGLDHGRVFRTDDGGQSWIEQGICGSILNSVFAVNANQCYASGFDEMFAITTNGSSWTFYPASNPLSDLQSVFFINADIGWMVGTDVGLICCTSNGGYTWQLQGSTGYGLFDIYFVNARTGWTVGRSGIIKKSTNGGITWTAQTSGTSNDLHSVFFLNSTDGWIVGDQGTILNTTDGGANWIPQSSGTTYDLFSIHGYEKPWCPILALDEFTQLEDNHASIGCNNDIIITSVNAESSMRNATIYYTASQQSDVSLTVFSMAGRVVYSSDIGVKSAGQHCITWDCTANNGEVLSSGVYLIRLVGDGIPSNTSRFVLTK